MQKRLKQTTATTNVSRSIMTKAILVTNIKGGTGKSTFAEQLAKGLRDEGKSVGLMDADIDSANMASRLGSDERVGYEGDHTIKPVEHDGLKLYSMENAFTDSSFSQSGQFMREVISNMINGSDWGSIDYLVVDCPPGSSDVFEELVSALRPNMLGAISVGQPDAYEDTARLVKVCNHNWIPIIGFVENMVGVVDSEGFISSPATGEEIYPFGDGDIEEFVKKAGGNFLGKVPLCVEKDLIPEYSEPAVTAAIDSIENSSQPELPSDHTNDESFIKNLWKGVLKGIGSINSKLDIQQLQDQYGVQDREPLTVELHLTDATGFESVMSKVILKGGDGKMKVMRPGKARRKGIEAEGGLRITSQDLYNAINGEKTVLNSVNGKVISEPYSIIQAVQMGDAEIWGEKTINRLSVLDQVLSEVVPMDEVQKALVEQ